VETGEGKAFVFGNRIAGIQHLGMQTPCGERTRKVGKVGRTELGKGDDGHESKSTAGQ
jgi:hypothetical protein